MAGQNLLPESNLISQTYTDLYGIPSPQILGILGSDWRIAARTPFQRLRGSDNLVVPDDKLPHEIKKEEVIYVCKAINPTPYTPDDYYEDTNSPPVALAYAKRFTASSKKKASCAGRIINSAYTTTPYILEINKG